MKDFEQFKEEVITSPRWIVSLDENDLKAFQGDDDCTITILEAETEDATEQRLRILFDDIAKQFNALEYPCGNSVKVLIHIQFPITDPLMMSDISVISYMVDLLIPKGLDCEVKWGLSPREDNLCKITCAINHSKK